MSFYGYKRNTTPNINNFFKNSYVFTNTFAPATLTYTDSVSLLFSLSPLIHRAYSRNRKTYTSEILKKYSSLADILGKNGYTTAAFVSDEDYEYDWGIGRTFQLYFDRSHYSDYGITYMPFSYSIGTKQLVPLVSRWLAENNKKKKFLFLQAYDMHCPFTPLDNFKNLYQSPHSDTIPFDKECFMAKEEMTPIQKDGKTKYLLKSFFSYLNKSEKSYYFEKKDLSYLISRYDAELNQADHNLQELFNKITELNLDKNSIIVFLTEHGDYLGENGYFFKTSATAPGNLHNANIGIPLIIKVPNQNKKIIQNQIIQSIDITPTLIDMLGLKADPKMQGKSFKAILNTTNEINDYSYAFSVRFGFVKMEATENYMYDLESLQNNEWKLNHSIQYVFPMQTLKQELYFLYNLKSDPEEKTNVVDKYPEVVKKLIDILHVKKSFYSRIN
jgi:arylsulfatase A-like enzyme